MATHKLPMGNSLRKGRTPEAGVDDFLSCASVVNMKVSGNWGDSTSIVVQPSPAVMKNRPLDKSIGLLKLDKSMHLKVLEYLEPKFKTAVGVRKIAIKERKAPSEPPPLPFPFPPFLFFPSSTFTRPHWRRTRRCCSKQQWRRSIRSRNAPRSVPQRISRRTCTFTNRR